MSKIRDYLGPEKTKDDGFRQKNHMVHAGRRRLVSQVRPSPVIFGYGTSEGVKKEWDTRGRMYHVTPTKHVKSIKQKGILPMQTSNWVKQGDGERYGDGSVHAFTNKNDAVRWAGKMDWDMHKGTGTGKISIVTFSPKEGQNWKDDDADPISQAGKKGEWKKFFGRVPAEQISGSEPVTTEMIRQATRPDSTEEKTADPSVVKDQYEGDALDSLRPQGPKRRPTSHW